MVRTWKAPDTTSNAPPADKLKRPPFLSSPPTLKAKLSSLVRTLLLLGLTLSGLTGCKTPRLLPGLPDTTALEKEIAQLEAAGVKKRPGVPVIDVHTHLFNSRYLPVHGIIVSREDDILTFPHQLLGFIGTGYWIRGRELEQLGSLLQMATPTDDSQPHHPLPTPAEIEAEARQNVAQHRAQDAWFRRGDEDHQRALERQRLLRKHLMQALWFKLPPPNNRHLTRPGEVELMRELEAAGMVEPLRDEDANPPRTRRRHMITRVLYDLAAATIRRHPLTTLNADNTRVITERGLDQLLSHVEGLGGLVDRPDPASFSALGRPFTTPRTKVEMVYWFALHLVAGERDLVNAMAHGENAGVDLYAHLMMNMAPSFRIPGEPETLTYDYEREQIPRAAAVDRMAAGHSVHFVAWNPFDSKDDFDAPEPRALHLIKEGIASGAVGVKFYPPMGYRPADNAEAGFPHPPSARANPRALQQWQGRYSAPRWTPEALDRLNMRLFRYCAQHDIPILTHCNHSEIRADGGADPDYGAMANPALWEPVLRQLPRLRLCFGHSGGSEHWAGVALHGRPSPAHASWGDEVQHLCLEYPLVFCESSLHFQVANPALAARLAARLIEVNPLRCKDGRHTFGDKIMYGSDWYMPTPQPPATFLNTFLAIYQTHALSPYYRRFFHDNAARFLKLGR